MSNTTKGWRGWGTRVRAIGRLVRGRELPVVPFAAAILIMAAATADAGVITVMGPENLIGGYEIEASATIEVSIYATTPTGGTIDFAFTNTSPLTEVAPGKYANAFLTEFQFNLPDGFEVNRADSMVLAPPGTEFSRGRHRHLVTTGSEVELLWRFGHGTGGGSLEREFEARIRKNYNAIFSGNAIGPDDVPWEDVAAGFLSNKKSRWKGGVFDTVIFRIAAVGDRPLLESDLSFYAADNLTGKFQGGNGSAWIPNAVYQDSGSGQPPSIPEPATLALAGAGLLLLMRRARGNGLRRWAPACRARHRQNTER